MSANNKSLKDIIEQEEKLKIEKAVMLQKALQGEDVNAIYQAKSYLKSIEPKDEANGKSILVDPMLLTSSFGYKDKPFQLSYEVLRGMSKTHIIKSIIGTRKDQIADFLVPQKDKYATGFIISKKTKFSSSKKEVKLSKQEEERIDFLTRFLLDCGTTNNKWHGDTFDEFVGKIADDSLTLDQATFEVVRNMKGEPIEFFATDAATHRLADSYWGDEERYREEIINGYTPAYVQLYQNKVINKYYPWELCFGVRNPSSNIATNGYGRAELEDMVQTVTAILNADFYNSNFFKVGSAPKGILRYSGNINQNTVEDFRRQWVSQVAGVMNMHKIPLINADKLDFINTTMSNKDMEFGKFQDFLIKIACAIFKIDPSEVGFPMNGSSQGGGGGLFGQDNKERVSYSKEKGLKPILKKIQHWINKYIISELDEEYEFRFVGIEEDLDPTTEQDRDIKAVGNYETLNEVRARRNLDPIDGGDIVLNPVYLQAKGMAMAGNPDAEGVDEEKDTNNPFVKALQEDLQEILG